MATITVKNIPAELYERLKIAAQVHRRSLNSEIIACVERAVSAQPVDLETSLARARELRRPTRDTPIGDADFDQLKAAGRP